MHSAGKGVYWYMYHFVQCEAVGARSRDLLQSKRMLCHLQSNYRDCLHICGEKQQQMFRISTLSVKSSMPFKLGPYRHFNPHLFFCNCALVGCCMLIFTVKENEHSQNLRLINTNSEVNYLAR